MAIHVAIEGYDSLEQIGIGGMAAVYKARKISIDKIVAIKVLFPYLAGDASFVDRFQREAKAAASIQHDNVVNVVDFGESDGSCYIVMEYYDGQTLEDLMKARPGIPVEVAAQILLEVAYGLEAAHKRDIVHRDIKPANIIYTRQGGIKIADFGLAKKSDSVSMITQHGKVIGTPAYMSPEQAAGRPVGPPSDIFSLGVVAYELFGRRKPFEGNTYSEVIEKIQTVTPPSVAVVNPLVDPEFERMVTRMLAKDDRDRHADAGHLIADLEAAMEKSKIARDRRRLAAYIADPDAYDARSSEKTITQCLSRGTFYMQKGEDHLEDALLEFRRILFLDPTNERARKNLERIRTQRGDEGKTLTLDAQGADLLAAARPQKRGDADRERPRTRKKARRRIPGWMYAVGVAGVAGLVAAMLWTGRGPGAAFTAVGQKQAPSQSAMGESPLDLVSGANDGAPASVEPARAASGADNGAARQSAADSVALPPGSGATDVPAVAAAKPAVRALETKPTEAKPTETKSAETKKATVRPEPVPNGTLSVFFLGGVGEVSVNGKHFDHIPPFEGVVMPAGTYRIACRMSGDDVPRELVVAIAPNRETVIEYELGGEPVASFSDEETR
jgi:serine/threonine protein kinase